jgi:hypothetical protein
VPRITYQISDAERKLWPLAQSADGFWLSPNGHLYLIEAKCRTTALPEGADKGVDKAHVDQLQLGMVVHCVGAAVYLRFNSSETQTDDVVRAMSVLRDPGWLGSSKELGSTKERCQQFWA